MTTSSCVTENAQPPGLKIETRSIDYVPRNERHGKVWHQGPFWFTGNFVLTTMVTGFTGAALGLALQYAILAIVIGVCLGTFCMAFHANQGPRMGLPQMIQSRAQFGLRGAIVPFTAVVFVYIGFNVFNVILATDAINTVIPGARAPWYTLMIAVAVLIAVIGHDLLHTVQRWLTYVMISVFAVLTVSALLTLQADSALADPQFSWSAFLIQLSAAAGYQISYSVYVSDYSRYLPHQTPSRQVIFWTYLGAAGSALWLMSLGAFLASALPSPDAIASVREVGNRVIPGFGTFTVLIAVPALVGIMAVNCYGAMLTGISAIDGFKSIKPNLKSRVCGIVLVAVVIFLIAMNIPESYLGSFNTFVLLMLYFLVPWTAVNLADFYLVRKGRYAISDIFNHTGIYGRWSSAGLLAYFLGLLAMVPFMSLSFFQGPLSQALGGADIAFVVGLAVAALVYWALTRNLDLDAERLAIQASEQQLEGGAQ
ncbi:NCS1 nucleoside transporter family [Pseudomonas protegens]|jgi:NCS1 nucleoside transporter family|uniref:Putative purine-cytosine permease YxlA n=1 Tax=Pseudomonas protegens (strain DSM 19095 / LMG 27888 / CFBP 6595 / CHA0) TaxID=1124983 RepID=A0A2C9EUR6_PSEPH|nr:MULTISPECIES: cytosine permease [Pseudomonas]AGL87413.1 putative purine-cytosine permease YxlA [Pseudomonas protegens CHA0]MBF0641524.1 cytosine permease [Pseudomonas protegens]MBP5108377.1 cytosine permease [Pseudomonas protegens]MCS4262730.1 NCS1 nucleoside transporter family [Pseudomonas sp. BIGb0176]NAN51871.1 cytosine permease [Pseudomonas protegens]